MGRTAYEVRLETLCLAREILSENRRMVFQAFETPDITQASGQSPDMFLYTVEDVLAEAKKLSAFVNDDER